MRRLLVLLLLLPLAACGASAKPTQTPAQVMAAAKQTLDSTSGLHFTLTGRDVPKTGSVVLSAEGDLTRQPAFDGTITVRLMGLTPKVPVRSVDGVVWAQIPLTTGWSKINPADYGVPDPAKLLGAHGGISDLLTHTTKLQQGKSVRGGTDNKDILTTYTGTVPGAMAHGLISSATGDLQASYTVDVRSKGATQLRSAVLTGDFYGDGGHETYTVLLDSYGLKKTIQAP